MKLNLVLLSLCIAVSIYAFIVRRQLETEKMRGNMYRDISARLDRRVTELMA